MKTLHLKLKKQWFDMTFKGDKKEEYREIKPYWAIRLLDFAEDMPSELMDEFCSDLMEPIRYKDTDEVLRFFDATPKMFDAVEFQNGYGKHSPKFSCFSVKLSVGKGLTRWGAAPGKNYFILKHGGFVLPWE